MILVLMGVMISIYSFFNFKKAFILFLAYQLFVSFGIQLIKVDGFSIPLGTIMSFLFFFELILIERNKKKNKLEPKDESFPFKTAFILITISRFMTCFTTLGTFSEEFMRAISFILQNIIDVYIAWKVFRTKDDFIYFFKLVTIVFFFACILGYIEYILQYNPYTNYEKSFIGEGINFYNAEGIRGYRLTSFFEHPIGAGMNFALYFVVSIYLYIQKEGNIPYRKLSIITSLICLPLVILSKQRSAIIFLLLISLSLIDLKKKKFYIFLCIAVIGLLLFSPQLSEYSDYLTSSFNEVSQEQVGGSSISMRFMQLDSSFELLKTSPLFGLGEKYNLYLSSYWLKKVLMLESVWLDQMVKHGIFGILAYLVLAKSFIFKVSKKYEIGKVKYILLGFWITYTITTIPSFKLYLLYILIFYLIRINKENINNESE